MRIVVVGTTSVCTGARWVLAIQDIGQHGHWALQECIGLEAWVTQCVNQYNMVKIFFKVVSQCSSTLLPGGHFRNALAILDKSAAVSSASAAAAVGKPDICYAHCHVCRREWKTPDPDGGVCTGCKKMVDDGRLPPLPADVPVHESAAVSAASVAAAAVKPKRFQ